MKYTSDPYEPMSVAVCTDCAGGTYLYGNAGLLSISIPLERRIDKPYRFKFYADKHMTLSRTASLVDDNGCDRTIVSISRDANISYVETIFKPIPRFTHAVLEPLEHRGQIWLFSSAHAFRYDKTEDVVELESVCRPLTSTRVEARDGTLYMDHRCDVPISRDMSWYGLQMHGYYSATSVCMGVESDVVYAVTTDDLIWRRDPRARSTRADIWRRDPRVRSPELIDHNDVVSLHNPGNNMYAITRDCIIAIYDERNNALVGCADPIVSKPEHMTVRHMYHI